MLFNSDGFLFIFLPLTLAAFAAAVRLRSPPVAVAVLIIASYVFYGWWEPALLILLAVSTAFNFGIGYLLTEVVEHKRKKLARIILAFGVGGDLALLGYYKYADFFIANLDTLAGGNIALPAIALPIGISFYTFTQIAFIVDAAQGKVARLQLPDYVLFVSYFPHLIAGPIIHHRATIPQFRRMAADGWDTAAIAMGLSIFAIGMFKKVAIADHVAPFADLAFLQATSEPPPMLDSWIGAIAYAFQIYFDFSGYSDMAIGLSLLFGVRLPVNFASPYKSTSIIEFWSRWHMSLSAFLRDYLYIPLGGNRKGTLRRYVNLMLTMLLGGLWHGAGWTFVVWGGLHGLYLVVNHGWRFVFGPPALPATRATVWLKRGIVCLVVTIAWVFFRADTIAAAGNIFRGMSGVYGFAANASHVASLGWIAACLFIVWALPNTYQIFARHDATLPLPYRLPDPPADLLAWRLNAVSALAFGGLLAGCVLAIYHFSPFLYFRF
jgi:alginate O-acetyltransferase complex protein AlgI